MNLHFRDCCDHCALVFEEEEKRVEVKGKKVHERCEEAFLVELSKPVNEETTLRPAFAAC